jgi:hypothetical protein
MKSSTDSILGAKKGSSDKSERAFLKKKTARLLGKIT